MLKSKRDDRNLLRAGIAVVCLASTFALVFVVAARTPRAGFNVMQGASALFVLTILARHIWHGTSADEAIRHDESFGSPWIGIALGTAAWLPALTAGFVSDDFAHLLRARGNYFTELWCQLTAGQDNTFMRPLGFASIFLDHALFGDVAAGYHATNLILHLLSVVAFYALIRRLGTNRNAALFIAGIYTAIPVQAEAVAWLGARFDLLSNALILWGLVFYLRFRESNRKSAYAATLLFCLLAMFSKENGFIMPVLVVVLELFLPAPRRIWGPAGLFGLGALAFVYRWCVLNGIGGYSSGGIHSAASIAPKTFEGLFLRGPTLLFTGINWTQPPGWSIIAAFSLLAATLLLLALGAELSSQAWRFTKLGIVWAICAMLPAHFLLMVGPALTNSRVFYMATPGAALILGHLILSLRQRELRQAAAALLTVLLSFGVLHNVQAWRWTSRISEETIQEVIRREPSPPANAEFVFSGMPDTIRGVQFLRVGLTAGLRMAYGREDLTARHQQEISSGSPTQIHFVWKGEGGNLIERQPD